MNPSRKPAAGFTLTELVVVIAIAATLSVFAVALMDRRSFDTEGFANRVAAMVRYAQKLAISQRRTVVVVTTAGNIKLCYTDSTCASAVLEPLGTNAFSHNAPSGVSLSATSISFSGLGSPGAGGTITVTGDVARNVVVEAETGYVH